MKYLEALMVSILSIFLPVKAAMITIVVLIMADLITGVWGAYKKKEKITSSGLRRTISKIIIYEIGLSMGFLAETFLLGGVLPLSKIIGGMIGLIEFKSISENLDGILGQSFFKLIVQKLGSDNEIEQKIKDDV